MLVNPGTNCGSVLMAVSTVLEPVRSKSSCVTETIGLAESKSGRAMREPVTKTCSSSASWPRVEVAQAQIPMSNTLPRRFPHASRERLECRDADLRFHPDACPRHQ